jgi:hypothetical protein
VIINQFRYPNDLKILLVEEFFPFDLLADLHVMCNTSETKLEDWHYADWTTLRKIHNGTGETYQRLDDYLRNIKFLDWDLNYVESSLWADYVNFGPLLPHKEDNGEVQGQIFLTDTTHKVNGTSMLNDNEELLFTLPFRDNYGWVMEDCQQTMHSREFDVIPDTIRYSLIFWHNHK